MPKFFYAVRDKAGMKLTGTEEASTQEEVISRLQARDFTVIDVSLATGDEKATAIIEGIDKKHFKFRHNRVTRGDLVLFCRQIATLLGAGITILKSLQIISKQIASRKLHEVILDLQKNMEGGLSFHEAMAKHPKVFSEIWINLVESGEASGNLAVVLSRLAGYLEREAEFRRKVISAVLYPAILLVASIGALFFLTIKIIPTFADLFLSFEIKLPLLTQMLIGMSTFVRKFFLFILIGLVAAIFFLRKYIQTKDGRKNFEQLLFKIPNAGEFFRALVMERFSSEMSTLVESGVPILYSLDIAEHSVGNLTMSEHIHKIKEGVREGKTISQIADKTAFFDPMVVQMIGIGEEIGELSSMLKKINVYYQEYVETYLARFTSMFEPLILIFIGGIVGTVVIGMFLPIFEIAQIGK